MEQHNQIRKLQFSCATVLTELFSTFINFKNDTARFSYMKRDTVVASITLAFQEKILKVQLKIMYAHQNDNDLIFILLTTPSPLNMFFKDPNTLVCPESYIHKCLTIYCSFHFILLYLTFRQRYLNLKKLWKFYSIWYLGTHLV